MRSGYLAAAALAVLAAACTTTGTGTGEERGRGGLRATFDWRESDPQGGDMRAQISDGRNYDGRYFQITRETRVDTLGPLWAGWDGPRWGYRGYWGGRWGGWGYWGPQDEFVTHYSGRVLANLNGPDGHLRCQFRLARPSDGMNGGGAGRCQLPDGTEIDADFDPHRG